MPLMVRAAVLLLVAVAVQAQSSDDALRRAAAGNDYRAFHALLEKSGSTPEVYRDIDAVWSYAQSSPTGAFFDEKSALMDVMRKYPRYPRAIADATLTSNGHTYYPTRETRLFLAG